MSDRNKNNGNFKFKGKQILLLGLVALVISAGYYRWTIESEELGKAVQTANETLPVNGDDNKKADTKTENKEDKNSAKSKDGDKEKGSDKNKNSDKAQQNSTGEVQNDNQSEEITKLRRDRDSARSASIEEWKKIQADDKNSTDSKKEAEGKIKQQTEAADAERRVENQVKAKGYEECFAYISENGISVTVKGGEIDGSKVAAIKDIIVNETHISVKNIKINSL